MRLPAIVAVEPDLGDEHAGGRIEATGRIAFHAGLSEARRGARSWCAITRIGVLPADARPASS